MIVDCHTHINFAADDGISASEHLEAAETVDACVVLARGGESSEEVNKKLAEYVDRYKEKMVGFAVVEPTKDNVSVKNLTSIKDKLGPFKPLEEVDYNNLKTVISDSLKDRLIELEVKDWESIVETLLDELNKNQSIFTMTKV